MKDGGTDMKGNGWDPVHHPSSGTQGCSLPHLLDNSAALCAKEGRKTASSGQADPKDE